VLLLESLDEQIASLGALVSCLEPAAMTGELAKGLAEGFSKGEKLCASAVALCARRVEETGRHAEEGHREASDWLAGLRGTTKRRAEEALGTAGSLAGLPGLEEAMRSGDLSTDQARLVSEAARLDPEAEGSLIERARTGSLAELQDEAEKVKAAARSKEEQEERHRRVHAGRHLRTWRKDGAFLGRFSLTPADGARLMGAVELFAGMAFEEARHSGRHERYEAYLADGLVALATREGAPGGQDAGEEDERSLAPERPAREQGDAPSLFDKAGGPPRERAGGPPRERAGGPPTRPAPPARRRGPRGDYTIFLRVDLEALSRGHLAPGEECSIDGAGPVPVSVVQSLLDTAKVRLVVTDGVEISSLYSCKRNINTALDTALRFRDRTCVVPGCHSSFHLERDHIKEFSRSGPTSLDNLCLLCPFHHRLKTTKGYRITGGPDSWRWLRPDGTPASAREQDGGGHDPPP
jgi:hypothetical protein